MYMNINAWANAMFFFYFYFLLKLKNNWQDHLGESRHMGTM